jgi:hypothetical protein
MTAEPLFPRHKCGLFLTHNEHRDFYQTAAEAIAEYEANEGSDCWASEDEKKRAIATDEIWRLQWYPETPVSCYCVRAATFESLIMFARSIESQDSL